MRAARTIRTALPWLVACQVRLVLAASLLLLGVYAPVPASRLARLLARAAQQPTLAATGALLTPARYAALRLVLAAVATLAAGGLLCWEWRRALPGFRPPPPSTRPLPQRRPRRGGWSPWSRLRSAEKYVALALVATVALLYLATAWSDPISLDEAISYDWFIRPGPAVAAGYYPFPNNHVLLNVVSSAVRWLLPAAPPLLVLRLVPTLVGLLTLVGSYCLLLSCLRFEQATLAWGLFSLSPGVAFLAVAGRGYGLVLGCLLLGTWATLALVAPAAAGAGARRRAWRVWGLAAAAGLYAVPTHLYGVVGLVVGLGAAGWPWSWRRARHYLGPLLAVGLGSAGLVAVLYLPVGAITGWAALLHNPFVQPLPPRELWVQLSGGYPRQVAGVLLGWPWLSLPLFGGVALLAPALLRYGALSERARCLGWLAYAQLLSWLPLLLAQRVLPPARTLMGVLFFFFVLGAMLADWGLRRLRRQWPLVGRGAGWRLAALVLVLGLYGGVRQAHYQRATAGPRRRQLADFARAQRWLRGQAPRQVWVDQLAAAVLLRNQALATRQLPLPVRVRPAGNQPPVAGQGEYLLLLDGAASPAGWEPAFQTGSTRVVRRVR